MPDWNAAILLALKSVRTEEGVFIAQAVSQLGGFFVITLVFVFAAYVLSRGRPWAHALGLIVALGGSAISAEVLKGVLRFDRPDAVLWAVSTFDYGFPSMHAAVATALYGYLAWYARERSPQWGLIAIALATAIVCAVGFSRMYLGIHWPIDIIGGYLLGIIFVFLAVRITRKLESFEEA